MNQKFDHVILQSVPSTFIDEVKGVAELLASNNDFSFNELSLKRVNAFGRALASSTFLQKQASLHPKAVLQALSVEVNLGRIATCVTKELPLDAALDMTEANFMSALRKIRNKQMLLIAWQDSVGCDVNDILTALSDLADALIRLVVNWSFLKTSHRFGVPRDSAGKEQQLIVIGMGKLGAHELNFSSDIDLIFCYPSAGETDGSRSISNEEFFTRMCRLIVKLLEKQTTDGFVYRVDTRLRPFGESGALVLNSDAMEFYYQSHAREWERYAMVKARIITGAEEDKKYLMSLLRSFVYRRYLDYGVFDSIRVMKRQIEEQLKKKGVAHNVKLGPGGIREIEFIGQAYQLIRGGRDTSLQERSIVRVLALLADKGYIPTHAAKELKDDYRYLRRLENRIQELDDKQTHELPNDEIEQARLVLAMEVKDWPELVGNTHKVMARVHGHFQHLVDFSPPLQITHETDWLALDELALEQYLRAKNITASTAIRRDVIDFCESYPVRQMQEKGRQYFMRLMPMLMDALLLDGSHENTLSAFLNMLEKICNRTVYLVLLVENKSVFDQLIRLAKLSPLIITQVTKSPILLDELIDPESLYYPPSKEELAVDLDRVLADIEQDNIEEQMEALRLFKQINALRVAAADLTDVIPLMVVSDKLTGIAEVIIEKVLTLSWQSACAQYGVPIGASADVVCGFAVIAYGKLGGIELGFSSDLDVIFLHENVSTDEMTVGDKAISLVEFYMRLGRKIITYMTTRTFSGPLYEMDLRLRPNGNSGLLVTSEYSFATYQKNQAWTWEHQALVRARFVAGCAKMGKAFNAIRKEVLATPYDTAKLRKDVIEMREKMRVALLICRPSYFDLKHGVGGIVDIEFIVQFGVLVNASRYKALLMYTDNVRLLLELNKVGFLNNSQQQGLSCAYKVYREALHHASLAEKPMLVDETLYEEHARLVSSVWKVYLNS
ncbi:MAG: bifunctional [glutamate--ammonia ligase]-adenylyl-L-tyrosine phosphorylase/[glutamate--ammonia-ligase] adenylyltransferase [Cycloclasticus sp.]|nr:MAG: bifunctional [glutamate--ammonia ligase]-adenylyl-L-tyrosine phosphorylase/[glutamate--ammonia-ligase] adenylyltransferase [Cycloclasticus sp.]